MTKPVVTIEEGQLRGKISENYQGGKFCSFLGVPYAKPPVGELRFKAPVPVDPWQGVKDATSEGSECPSVHMFFNYPVGNEQDCLNLNVYTRELPGENSAPKPVMVWVHGGAFLFGSNRSEFFGPDYLMTEDIVLVSINYRLGVLGFLSCEDPSLGIPGNAGLKDMVLALKWVQRNIRKFGGDPSNVTIFGESAGSASVHYLYLSPMTRGLFHKVIAQSGSALNCWAKGIHNTQSIANLLEYKETDEKKIVEYLKGVPAQKLVKAQHKAFDAFTSDVIRPFGPVVEKPSNEEAFLLEDPIDILKKGTFNQVPVIMGYTSKEGIFFNIVRKVRKEAALISNFENEIHYELGIAKGSEKSKEVARKIEKYYFGEEKSTEANLDKLLILKTDTQFAHGIHRSVCHQKLNGTAPIYLYRISLDTNLNLYKKISTSRAITLLFVCYFFCHKAGEGTLRNLFLKLSDIVPNKVPSGVCHADDLGYLFKMFISPKLVPGSVEEVSVRRFVKLWTNFARTSNPTPDANDPLIGTEWLPVTKEKNRFLDIGKELKSGVDPDAERMQFWDSIYN